MEQRTTIQLPRPLVDRLKRAKGKGETYADLIDDALKALAERRTFLDEQMRLAEDVLAGKSPYRVLA